MSEGGARILHFRVGGRQKGATVTGLFLATRGQHNQRLWHFAALLWTPPELFSRQFQSCELGQLLWLVPHLLKIIIIIKKTIDCAERTDCKVAK